MMHVYTKNPIFKKTQNVFKRNNFAQFIKFPVLLTWLDNSTEKGTTLALVCRSIKNAP